ncbi:radical SAM protein [Oceanithermus sp.]
MIAFWDITSSCNFKCIHCYNSSLYFTDSPRRSRILNRNEALTIAQNLIANGIKYVHFLGGEPLLFKHIFEVTEVLSRSGVVVTVNTNGSMLTYENAKKLLKAGVRGITVSLDGASPHTNDLVRGEGAFHRATRGIRHFIAARKVLNSRSKLAIGFTLTRPGLEDIEQLIPLARALQVDDVNIQYLSDFGGAGHKEVMKQLGYAVPEALQALEKIVLQAHAYNFLQHLTLDTRPLFNYYIKLKHHVIIETSSLAPPICEGGTGQINVRADGTAHPCSPADDTPGEVALANGWFIKEDIDISKQALGVALSSKYFTSFRHFVASREDAAHRPATCRGCPFQNECMPCPLDVTPGDPVDECEWTRRQLYYLERDLLKKGCRSTLGLSSRRIIVGSSLTTQGRKY